ncbi:hypothetical protein OROMI_004634 [Orobanche minor]
MKLIQKEIDLDTGVEFATEDRNIHGMFEILKRKKKVEAERCR